jgi:hypothetical protein
VSGASYVANSFMASTSFDTLIEDAPAPPNGTLDVAFADNNNFTGGNANGALVQGQTETVSLLLSTALDATAYKAAFAAALNNGLTAVMRFQQVNAGAGSDKLLFGGTVPTGPGPGPGPGPNPAPVPLPAAGWMLLAALGGMAFWRRRAIV